MKFEIGDKVLHTGYNEVATVIGGVDTDDMVHLEFEHPFEDILPCNYKSYWAYPVSLELVKKECLRDPENGALACSLPILKRQPLKIGDRVRYNNISDSYMFGRIGTIISPDEDRKNCWIVAYDDLEGFDYDGLCPDCNGFSTVHDNLEIFTEPCEPVDECQVPEEFTVEPITPAPPNYYDKHYDGAIQPIELMQLILTPEEFKGFLKGNIIKYTMRCGKKDDPEKEFTKIRRYKQWLDLAEEGITIDPRV